MKVIILAGGRGTRITEETEVKPKPMIKIGELPIICHLMKYYSSFGHNEFIICLGYKGYVIKEYFSNYLFLNSSHVELNTLTGEYHIHQNISDNWNIHLLETGLDTSTAGRLRQAFSILKNDEKCFLSYGDVLSNVDLHDLEAMHLNNNKLITVTGGIPPSKYGSLQLDNSDSGMKYSLAKGFTEKPFQQMGWVSTGFFLCDKRVDKYIHSIHETWEQEPLQRLCSAGELGVFKHSGFWQPVDTVRDKLKMQKLWGLKGEMAPWCVW